MINKQNKWYTRTLLCHSSVVKYKLINLQADDYTAFRIIVCPVKEYMIVLTNIKKLSEKNTLLKITEKSHSHIFIN